MWRLLISVVGLISRSALAGFSLLRASNYYYSKVPVNDFSTFYIQYCYSKRSIFFLLVLSQDTTV